MLSLLFCFVFSLFAVAEASHASSAGSVNSAASGISSQSVKQIAVIGAGAAGSSTAYHLQKFARQENVTVNITLFERTGRVGGRTLTVDVYDNPVEPVELGASIFVEVNHILWNATKEFHLPLINPGSDEDGLLGIWDGDKFVYTQDSKSWGWWNLAKLWWKYGTVPYTTRSLVQKTIATFLKMYEPPHFPFRSLSTKAFELGLVKITGLTGQQWLAENKLDGAFAHDVVQTSTRVNYASNLAYIHGLGAMVSMAAEGASAVSGGNWRIFSSMVKSSGAHLNLNTSVTSIAVETSKDPNSPSPRYTLRTSPSDDLASQEIYPITFDDVVVATPWQFSNITEENEVIQHPIDNIPYVTLHVTLFASPLRFSPSFFKLDPGSEVPISVLTTLGANEIPKSGSESAGKAGFYSVTLVKTVTNPKTMKEEFVYKIFSPEIVTPSFLSALLGVKIPGSFIQDTDTANVKDQDDVDPISWYYPAVFQPYPQKSPRVTFQDPILREGLYYTSGIESFISTMETSALMGMNVARLILDNHLSPAYMAQEDVENIIREPGHVSDSPREL